MISLGSPFLAPWTTKSLPFSEKFHKTKFNASCAPKLHTVCASPNPFIVAAEYGQVKAGENQLPEGLVAELMPNHVAVIMDGNRRWAIQRGLPVMHGHRAIRTAMHTFSQLCSKLGIQALTLFAFSTENWIRPKVCDIF